MANDSKGGSKDPVANLQQIITDWERRIDSVANRVMGTDEFSRGMNTVQNLQLGMQRAFMEAMAAHLNNLNMPSRADVTEIGETLRALDRRITRMEALLQRMVGEAGSASPARKGPPRTRRPPSAVGGSAT